PKGGGVEIAGLPDSRIICNCLRISKGEILTCVSESGCGADGVADRTGASTVCGSCRPLIDQICGGGFPSRKSAVSFRSLLFVSIAALCVVLLTVMAPPVAMADSVESLRFRFDQFWRDPLVKQISGFSLLGIFLIGLLLSLRKRFAWFRIGRFAKWRFFHASFGLLALVALFFHTGFRFGHNLNFWLMFTFVGLNLLGAVAGVVTAIESSGVSSVALRARRFRPFLTYAHIILFWPLPVLLTFHILSVYLY
ncbi:MAG: (2Fe-2S)-binding protein, partial [Verrucomicrobiota bacterium]